MKKLICVTISIIMLFLMSSCNLDISLGTYSFTKIHDSITNTCHEINSWNDHELGVEVDIKNYGRCYFSEGTYILISKECPICSK